MILVWNLLTLLLLTKDHWILVWTGLLHVGVYRCMTGEFILVKSGLRISHFLDRMPVRSYFGGSTTVQLLRTQISFYLVRQLILISFVLRTFYYGPQRQKRNSAT